MDQNNEQVNQSQSHSNSPQGNPVRSDFSILFRLLAARTASPGVNLDTRTLAVEAMEDLLRGDSGNHETDEEDGNEHAANADADEDDPDWIDDDDRAADMDDVDDDLYAPHRCNPFPPSTSPEPAGINLIKSGEFGRAGPKLRSRRNDKNLASVINRRLLRPHLALFKEDLASDLVPNSHGVVVANYGANIYSAQYSNDSSFFYTCSQDFRLHIYDTTSPPQLGRRTADPYDPYLQTTMKVNRSIQGQHGRWTITDANLSPDNQRIIYSSITSTAYICNTMDDNPTQVPIPFHDARGRTDQYYDSGPGSFGIFSCRFSADGNEVIAGGRGHLFVYDLLANKRSVKIKAHNDDINSCCWADSASGNVLVSASDDSFLKVWDRRSLGASPKPSGVLIGHTEGLTYVSAKGDGRYIVSNGKDQAMRLWDLRKMRSSAEFERVADIDYGAPNFDYRYESYPIYPKPRYRAHPQDCSVMTYRGHSVLMTLIRCHFSPAETTGGQYLYSGSADGRIHIWSLDGTIVQVLDRKNSLRFGVDSSGPEYTNRANSHVNRAACVRDVSWHSQQPVLMSAAWESSRSGSTLARHEWKGLSKLSNSLEDWNEKRVQQRPDVEAAGRRTSRTRSLRTRNLLMPGTYFAAADDSDDEDFEL